MTRAAVRTSLHDVAAAATATADFVKSHANAIEVGIVSAAVFLGCEAVLGVATGGVGAVAGAVGCGMLAGAVSGALSYGVQAVQTHAFSWQGLARSVAAGGVIGAVGGLGGGLLGKAGSALSSLLTDGAASDAATTADSLTADGAASTRAAASTDPADTITIPATGDAPADTGPAGGGGGDAGQADATGPAGSDGQAGADTPSRAQASAEAEEPAAAACGGRSFTAGTKVLTAAGSLIAISRLKAGEKARATNTRTGKTTAQPIAAVLVHHDTNRYNLKTRAGHRTAVIHTTSSHLFWNPATHKWVKAIRLRPGSRLLSSSGASVTVAGGRVPARTAGWMWDLTVPGGSDHDFYVVAGSTPVLVHNCGTGTTTFYTVQGPGDAARLSGDGAPWPTAPGRAHFGPGVYAWGNIEDAMAYAANKPGSTIMRFSVGNDMLASFNQAHLGAMSDDYATNFMEQYSLLWDGDASHGLDYISRPTAIGTENYFSSNVFGQLNFEGP